MFFGKKKQEEFMQSLAELKQEVALQAEKIEGIVKGCMENTAADTSVQSTKTEQQLETLSGRMDEFQKMQKKQMQSFEDFLDEEQERADRGEALRERAQECEAREKNLLVLIGSYQEQLHLLRRQMREEFQADSSKASAWEKQFEIVDEGLRRQMYACALEQTGKEMELVDFNCHQILKVIDTEDAELDNRVAAVFSPGCIYHGKIIKKSQVAAYRRINDGNGNRD